MTGALGECGSLVGVGSLRAEGDPMGSSPLVRVPRSVKPRVGEKSRESGRVRRHRMAARGVVLGVGRSAPSAGLRHRTATGVGGVPVPPTNSSGITDSGNAQRESVAAGFPQAVEKKARRPEEQAGLRDSAACGNAGRKGAGRTGTPDGRRTDGDAAMSADARRTRGKRPDLRSGAPGPEQTTAGAYRRGAGRRGS